MKTALITGTTGQDGALLSKFLLDKEYKVIGMIRRTSSPTNWRLIELDVLNNKNFLAVSGDLTDQASIDRIIIEYKPNEIYNLGAQSDVGYSWANPESTLNITGLGAMRIFESSRKYCPDVKIYQASSSEMFGGANRREYLNELSTFQPRSPYGVAKVLAHNLAHVYNDSYGMQISCGILFNHESEFRGVEFVTRKISFGVAKMFLGISNYISLGCLDSVRDWGFAGDYVEAMYLMLQRDSPEDFVIAKGISFSVGDFCKRAFECAGNGGYIEDYKNWENYVKIDPRFVRPADVKCLMGDNSKAIRMLKWKPNMKFGELVERMVRKDIERVKAGQVFG